MRRFAAAAMAVFTCVASVPSAWSATLNIRFGTPFVSGSNLHKAMEKFAEVAAAWPRKPSLTSEDAGTPAASHTALARSTAGVQLPQQPMPEMARSTPSSRKRCGKLSSTSCSPAPWVVPKAS